MKRRAWLLGLTAAVLFALTSCDIIPSNFNFGVNANVDVETTSDLGDDTLERVDAVNETLASGIEVGPETRETIEELNQTIKNGVKAGFDEETLARVDELLRVVEDGLKIGLDDDTLDTIDGMVETIDAMPGQWENTAEDVIHTLETSAGTAAAKMAKEVKGVMSEARLNFQQMTAVTGTEFRCNVDFLGSKAGATVQEFIGKSIVGKIRQIVSGDKPAETVPTPWVCQIIPDKIVLSPVGERLVYEEGVIALTGYNYTSENNPTAFIQDENGQRVSGYAFPVYRTSPYQLQLNLQDLDMTAVPARSRLVISWPNVAETSGISILLPANQAPIAAFSADPSSGAAPLTVHFTDQSFNDPTQWEWVFGDGSTSNEQNPVHPFTEGGSFNVHLTATNSRGSSTVTNIISVGIPLRADFDFDIKNDGLPLIVNFEDKSEGSPTSWHWDFGDDSFSDQPNPTHVYDKANSNGYTVSLTVTNPSGSQTFTSPSRIYAYTPVTADFSANPTSGKPPLTVKFHDESTGEVVARLWEFGDGSTSTIKGPTHKYLEAGSYDVRLTVTRADGKKDTKTSNGFITARRVLLQQFSPSLQVKPFSMPENSVYFTSFQLAGSYQSVDTGISSDQYLCVVAGMEVMNGAVLPVATGDVFTSYLYSLYSGQFNKNTWRVTAGFPTYANSIPVDIMCLSRQLEGKVFTYKDNFQNIDSAKPVKTGLTTSDYFNCSIAGARALGPANLPLTDNGVQVISYPVPVVLQAFMDGTGDEWTINVDMALDREEKWNVNVICFKRGDYLLGISMVMKTGDISFPGGTPQPVLIGESAQDSMCAVGGWSATGGDQGVNYPDIPFVNPIRIRPMVQNGTWAIMADHANHTQNEAWRLWYWCVKKPYAVMGPPPP